VGPGLFVALGRGAGPFAACADRAGPLPARTLRRGLTSPRRTDGGRSGKSTWISASVHHARPPAHHLPASWAWAWPPSSSPDCSTRWVG
jgi:hypothetical protein